MKRKSFQKIYAGITGKIVIGDIHNRLKLLYDTKHSSELKMHHRL